MLIISTKVVWRLAEGSLYHQSVNKGGVLLAMKMGCDGAQFLGEPLLLKLQTAFELVYNQTQP